MSLSKTDIEPIIQNIQNVDTDSFLNFLEKTPLDTYDLVFHSDDDNTINTRITDLNDLENFMNNTKTGNGTYLAILDDNSNCIDRSFMIKPIVIFTKEQQESAKVVPTVDAPADAAPADAAPADAAPADAAPADAAADTDDAPAADVVDAPATDTDDAPATDDVVDTPAETSFLSSPEAPEIKKNVEPMITSSNEPSIDIQPDIFGNIPTSVKQDEIRSSETVSEEQPKLSRPKLSFGTEELSKAALDLNPVDEIPNLKIDTRKNLLKSISDNKTKLKPVELIEKQVDTTIKDELENMKKNLKRVEKQPVSVNKPNTFKDALNKKREEIMKLNKENKDNKENEDDTWRDSDNTWKDSERAGGSRKLSEKHIDVIVNFYSDIVDDKIKPEELRKTLESLEYDDEYISEYSGGKVSSFADQAMEKIDNFLKYGDNIIGGKKHKKPKRKTQKNKKKLTKKKKQNNKKKTNKKKKTRSKK